MDQFYDFLGCPTDVFRSARVDTSGSNNSTNCTDAFDGLSPTIFNLFDNSPSVNDFEVLSPCSFAATDLRANHTEIQVGVTLPNTAVVGEENKLSLSDIEKIMKNLTDPRGKVVYKYSCS
jgi:hypothetical protein